MASRESKTEKLLVKEIESLRDQLQTCQNEQVEREQAIRESAESAETSLRRYERIVSTSTDMLAFIDKTFTYLAVNRAYLRAFDKTHDDIIGHTIAEVFGEEFFAATIKPHADRCLAGEEVHYQDWFEFAAAGRRYMEITYYPCINDDESIEGFVVNGRDATARKRAEESLDDVFSVSPDMLAVCTTDGGFLKLNPAWDGVLGYRREEMLELGWAHFVHPDDVEATDATVREQLEGGSVVSFVNRFVCKDGSYRTLEWQATYAKSDIVHAAARDITERVRTEKALRDSRNQLRRLARRLESVREDERAALAGELHDQLGQTLTALQIDVSVLMKKERGYDKEEQDRLSAMSEMIGTAIKTVQHMSMELRSSILDDLGLAAALEWQSSEFQEKTGIRCEFVVEEPVVDRELNRNYSTVVFRVCQEALTNISRHAEATLVIVVLKKQNGNVALEVRDDGKGITKDQIDSIESLGLIGMRERCLSCDGKMAIAGEPGKGTTVTVIVPID